MYTRTTFCNMKYSNKGKPFNSFQAAMDYMDGKTVRKDCWLHDKISKQFIKQADGSFKGIDGERIEVVTMADRKVIRAEMKLQNA